METIGEERGRSRERRRALIAAAVGAMCAIVGAAVVIAPSAREPDIEVETAKPPVVVDPASRPVEGPATTSTTAEPSTTTSSSVPTTEAPVTTSTTPRRRPPAPSSTTTTSKITTTTTTASTVTGPVALDRPGFYIANLDGSGLRRVSTEAVPGTSSLQPAISPDGRFVASIEGGAPGEGADIVVMNLAAGTVRRLGPHVRTGMPVWSPDSKRLAFLGTDAAQRSDRDVWIADAAGIEPNRVIAHPGDDTSVAWGPDGRLASTSAEGIAVHQPDGSGRTIVYGKDMGLPGILRWSPDATMVAAIPSGFYVSVIAQADGGGFTELHHFYSGYGITGDLAARELDWAPGSDRLVLAGGLGDRNPVFSMRVVKADGTVLWTRPVEYQSPDWAPAGDVMASLVDGQIRLYDAKAGEATGVFMTPPSGMAVKSFTWMPDGTAIAFSIG
jgi:dipeptidyl aminopeptidase/acylaminoacyl peptidase